MSPAAVPGACDVPVWASGSESSGVVVALPVACSRPVGVAPDPPPDEPDLMGERVSVTGSGLRFRAGASTDATILGLLYPGDVLFVNGEHWVDDDWLAVTVIRSVTGLPYTAQGWVHRDYVAVQG
jgi:hypothetical protein